MKNERAVKLKKLLQLDNLPRVYFARVIGVAAYTIYFIFYDTRRPYINITTAEAHKKDFPAVTPFNGSERLSLTILRPIEDFHGTFVGSIFVRVDLSGRFGNQRQYYREKTSHKLVTVVKDLSLNSFHNLTDRFFLNLPKVHPGGHSIVR